MLFLCVPRLERCASCPQTEDKEPQTERDESRNKHTTVSAFGKALQRARKPPPTSDILLSNSKNISFLVFCFPLLTFSIKSLSVHIKYASSKLFCSFFLELENKSPFRPRQSTGETELGGTESESMLEVRLRLLQKRVRVHLIFYYFSCGGARKVERREKPSCGRGME